MERKENDDPQIHTLLMLYTVIEGDRMISGFFLSLLVLGAFLCGVPGIIQALHDFTN